MNPIKVLLKIEDGEVQPKSRGIFGALVPVVLYLLFINIYGMIVSPVINNDNPIPILLIIVLSILAIGAVIIVSRKLFYEEDEVKVASKKRINFRIILLGLFLSIGVILITLPLISVAIMPFIEIDINAPSAELNNIGEVMVFSVMYANIFAPLCEEILLRGVVLGGFLKRYSPAVSIILSALIFGIMHFSLKVVAVTISGIVLGFLYYKFKSIILCFLIHFFNNMFASFSPFILNKIFPNPNFNLTPTSILISLASIGLGVLITFFVYKLLKKEFNFIESKAIAIDN